MPFDTPEQALLFDLTFAVKSFPHAPPPKNHGAAMREWKERLAKHVMEHLQLAQWEFRQKEPQYRPPSVHMPLIEPDG
jgi:hypothetical protein